MEKPIIHQIVSGFRSGDAISSEALLFARLAAENGYESHIYCSRNSTSPDLLESSRDLDSLPGAVKPGDVALLHLSIGNRSNEIFASLGCRKAILYHNVTPSHFFDRLDPAFAETLREGRLHLSRLAGIADVNLADSSYNARELSEMGYGDVKVLPFAIDADFGSGPVHPGMRDKLTTGGGTNIIFVGRVVPNKRFDKLLEVFSYYQQYVDPDSRLVMAGSSAGQYAYKSILLGMAYTLAVKRFVFTEFLAPEELNACYATASAFLCMSDHEGFCAPLLEAMAWNVPVFANAAAAVPETLDGAGVLFENADSATIAETIGKVIHTPSLKDAVLARQNERLAKYRSRDVWAELSGLLGL